MSRKLLRGRCFAGAVFFLVLLSFVLVRRLRSDEDSARCLRVASLAGAGFDLLARAHAHNDYDHERPLFDALECGIASVEADIYAVEGKLLVAHRSSELNPTRTLQSLYLDPLAEMVRRNQGRVFPQSPEFTLLIDIKSDAEPTYQLLREVLLQYQGMLTTFGNGLVEPKAVTVVLSGNRPWLGLPQDEPRYAGLDGRLDELNAGIPATLMPLVSDKWDRYFEWDGDGFIPEAERQKLLQIVGKVREQGRRLRFWATPEKVGLWQELWQAGVDYINTDHLGQLQRFLLGIGADFPKSGTPEP